LAAGFFFPPVVFLFSTAFFLFWSLEDAGIVDAGRYFFKIVKNLSAGHLDILLV
jgi:hypothetical protein